MVMLKELRVYYLYLPWNKSDIPPYRPSCWRSRIPAKTASLEPQNISTNIPLYFYFRHLGLFNGAGLHEGHRGKRVLLLLQW